MFHWQFFDASVLIVSGFKAIDGNTCAQAVLIEMFFFLFLIIQFFWFSLCFILQIKKT